MNVRLGELKIKEPFSLGGLKLANMTVNGGGYERGYEAGYSKGETDGYDKGFTEGQESVDRIYKTSGSFVKSNDYGGVAILHGLPKAPKLVMCFTADYTTRKEVNLTCGFVYTEKAFTSYKHQNVSRPSVREQNAGIPNIPESYAVDYYIPSVDDIYIRWSGGSGKYGGEFFWEAYTW